MVTTQLFNNISLLGSLNVSNRGTPKDFYRQLKSIPNTIISIQYNSDKFLTFHVNRVQQGEVIYSSDAKATGLRCRINDKTYIFTREHLDQMSNRECRDLCHYLGFDGSQLIEN